MKIGMQKNLDLVIVLILTFLSMPFILIPPLNEISPIRIILGLPLVLFLPGYTLIATLFPRKDDLDGLERIALGFGLSIAITPLLGLALNYTPFGIRLSPVLIVLSIFTISLALGAYVRRSMIPEEGRFVVDFDKFKDFLLAQVFFSKKKKCIDRILTVVLIISIIIAISMTAYVIITPKEGEKFTEFYVLGPGGKAEDYPTNLKVGEEGEVLIGVVNHEYANSTYQLEMRLNGEVINEKSIELMDNETWESPFTFKLKKAGEEQKLVVVGDKRMAVFDDISDEKLLLYPHEIEWVNRIPVPHMKDAEAVEIETEEPLKEECQHFLDCISSRETPRTNGREGLRVLEILQVCQESIEKGGEPVSMRRRLYFAHPTAVIDEPCEIGEGTKIWHFSHVMSGSKIGKGCTIGQNIMIAPEVSIGNNVKIQNNVSVFEGVIIEDNAFLGPSMVFTNVTNPRSFISRRAEFKKTVVKRGATIGANATVICGNTIGKYAFVGAAAVVTKDVPDYALVVGNPARITGWMCACGNKLNFSDNFAACKCGKKYKKSGDRVEEIK